MKGLSSTTVSLPNTAEELQIYTTKLNGILHQFAAETQKLVQSYRMVTTQLKDIIGGRLQSTPELSEYSTHLSNQWNSLAPLADRLKDLIAEDFGEDTTRYIEELRQLINRIEDDHTTMIIEKMMNPASVHPEIEKDLKNFDAAFPRNTLQLLSVIKGSVAKHLVRMQKDIESGVRRVDSAKEIRADSQPKLAVPDQNDETLLTIVARPKQVAVCSTERVK